MGGLAIVEIVQAKVSVRVNVNGVESAQRKRQAN